MNFSKKEILEIIKADYRQRIQCDEMVLEGLVINEKTLIGEWTDACNLVHWQTLSSYFNEWFAVEIEWSEWKTVVFPEWDRTLGDLAALLSKYAVKPIIQPIQLFGRMCLKAGAFKMLLQRLEKRGADTADIQPSTPMAEWLKSNVGHLMQEVNLIAPKALPTLKIEFHKGYDYGFKLISIGYLAFFVSCFLENYFFIITSVLLVLIGHRVTSFFAKKEPTYVAFQGITDFRDLVEKIIEKR